MALSRVNRNKGSYMNPGRVIKKEIDSSLSENSACSSEAGESKRPILFLTERTEIPEKAFEFTEVLA